MERKLVVNRSNGGGCGQHLARTGESISIKLEEPPSRPVRLAQQLLTKLQSAPHSSTGKPILRVPAWLLAARRWHLASAGAAVLVTILVLPLAVRGTATPTQAHDVSVDQVGFLISDRIDPLTLGSATVYQSLAATVAPGSITRSTANVGGQVVPEAVQPRRYTIQKGDTLSTIAEQYGYTSSDLVLANEGLDADLISPGREITIPDQPASDDQRAAEREKRVAKVRAQVAAAPVRAKTTTGTTKGWVRPLTSYTYVRGISSYHRGIDLAAAYGTTVRAARDGCVINTGSPRNWNGGFGGMVVIDSGGGITAVYAHLSSISVEPGECVSAGSAIGKVGSTGNSTGPHLHFEPRINGSSYDPGIF